MKRPFFFYLLVALQLFLGSTAGVGGFMLLLKSDGSLLGMQHNWLDHSPFGNYFIPGLILFTLNGLFPLFISIGLIWKPNWKWANVFNIYNNRFWAWTYSLYAGIISIVWITVQLIMTTYFWLQPIIIFMGLLIIIFTMMPSVMKYYERK